jgi:hypothetical protein
MSMEKMNRRQALLGAAAAAPAVASAAGSMPTVRLGGHEVSRLIVGGNPVSGHSHIDSAANREMIDYFTAANVMKMLRQCEQAGVNAWQSRGDRHIVRLLHEYRQAGGRLHWIAQTATELADIPGHIRTIASQGKPIAIYNHGSHTDRCFDQKKMDVVRMHCQVMRDAGVPAGVGTHRPEVIDYIESAGWDVDFYMTCVYNLTRSKEEASRLAGREVEGEYFHHPDRERMLERVRKTTRPCLIFKVYGASRNCGSAEQMQDALRLAFRYAKPGDAVVIGMFPKYKDQVSENCRLVKAAVAEASRPS